MSDPGAGAPTPPGWYADGTGGTRWWDGQAWTQHVAPTAPAVPAPPDPQPVVPPATYAAPATSWSTPAQTGPNPWAPGPVGSAPAPRRTGLVVGIAAAAVGVLVVGGGAVVLLTRSTSAPTATAPTVVASPSTTAASATPSETPTSTVSTPDTAAVKPVTSATQGAVVYSDDFTDTGSGWGQLALPSGTRFSYAGGQYVVVAKGNLHHYSYAPYGDPVAQISVTADYVTTAGKAGSSGVGVSCDQGKGASALLYEFMVYPGKEWFIEEVRGSIGSDPPTTVLRHGRTSAKHGKIAVTGACTTSADGTRTVVTLFINGARVGQGTSTRKPPSDGWLAGVDVASLGTRSRSVAIDTVTVRDSNG